MLVILVAMSSGPGRNHLKVVIPAQARLRGDDGVWGLDRAMRYLKLVLV
jgi:hypothetical protein